MPEFWILLLALGASLRLTRLVTGDLIMRPLRDAIERRFGKHSWQREFVGCPWCVGFWITSAVTVTAFCPKINHHPVFLIITAVLSLSWVLAIAANSLDRTHP